MDEGRKLYLATMKVFPSAGPNHTQSVHVVADSLEGAMEKAEPVTGYAGFELVGIKHVGIAQVARKERKR